MSHNTLIVRNDKLGDFMLSWPVFALCKHFMPDGRLTVLIPEYTASMAELCPWIDDIIIDRHTKPSSLAHQLKPYHFDSMLTLFSTGRVAAAGLLARIPYRLAPATKISQVLYTNRLKQRRSHSVKPEYAYNLDLLYKMLFDLNVVDRLHSTNDASGDWLPTEVHRPLLSINSSSDISSTINPDKTSPASVTTKKIIVHPGSGGSANNLRGEQFAQIANHIGDRVLSHFIITAGPNELELAEQIASKIRHGVAVYHSIDGLADFAHNLNDADLFISGSTGPLHIAGAMNLNTAAFYPGHRSATPLRWQTLNAPARRLAFTPPTGSERDVTKIDVDAAARTIVSHFFG